MKAWTISDFTGIEHQKVCDIPAPAPAAGEVLLAVELAALNPADYYLAQGHYPAKPKMPHVLGRDGIGTVTALGPGVTNFKVGDRAVVLRSEIGVNRPGMFAEQVVVPTESLVHLPAGWTAEQAAAAPLVYLTAYQALMLWNLPPCIVLITGATGGVGVAATQLAAAMGHQVVGLSRSSEKGSKLKQIGAAWTFDPQDAGWPKQLKSALNGQRVRLAIDNVAGPLLPQVIDTLGDHGRLACIGMLAGPVPSFNTASLFFRRIQIGGVAVGAYTAAESQAAWKAIVAIMDQANARPLIDSVHPFDQLPEAFVQLKRGPMGKVLLRI
jgi:NADPH2:quinone reductase